MGKISNWTSIFFRWVGSTTNQLTTEPNWDDPSIRQGIPLENRCQGSPSATTNLTSHVWWGAADGWVGSGHILFVYEVSFVANIYIYIIFVISNPFLSTNDSQPGFFSCKDPIRISQEICGQEIRMNIFGNFHRMGSVVHRFHPLEKRPCCFSVPALPDFKTRQVWQQSELASGVWVSNILLGGSSQLGSVVHNHGDHKSCKDRVVATPSKWPFLRLTNGGATIYLLTGMILRDHWMRPIWGDQTWCKYMVHLEDFMKFGCHISWPLYSTSRSVFWHHIYFEQSMVEYDSWMFMIYLILEDMYPMFPYALKGVWQCFFLLSCLWFVSRK